MAGSIPRFCSSKRVADDLSTDSDDLLLTMFSNVYGFPMAIVDYHNANDDLKDMLFRGIGHSPLVHKGSGRYGTYMNAQQLKRPVFLGK